MNTSPSVHVYYDYHIEQEDPESSRVYGAVMEPLHETWMISLTSMKYAPCVSLESSQYEMLHPFSD